MTEYEALLRAVLRDPDDDTVRLALADWLDENAKRKTCLRCQHRTRNGGFRSGGCRLCDDGLVSDGLKERAEFIRVQVALSKLKHPLAGFKGCIECASGSVDGFCDYHSLQYRENKLYNTMLDQSTPEQSRRTIASVVWARDALGKHVLATPYRFRRGFIEEITVSENTLFGAVCEGCYGTESLGGAGHGNWPMSKCPRCPGIGREASFAKRVFGTHPVKKVTLQGAEPNSETLPSGPCWYLHDGSGRSYPHWLPGFLVSYMTEVASKVQRDRNGVRGWVMTFSTTREAHQALSDTLVAVGRKLVGLPPLDLERKT